MEEIKQPQTRLEWFSLVDEQSSSGLSQTEFCKQRNLTLCRFGYYKKLRAGKPNVSEASFSPVVIKQSHSVADVRVELPNGFCCHVPVGISPEKLKQLVGALISC